MGPPQLRTAALTVLLVAGLLLPAVASAANPYRHRLAQVDAHLRMAIETLPAELGEHLVASEDVCGLGERAEARGDAAAAQADWSTLGQVVSGLDDPTLWAIDAAFDRADTDLRALLHRFSSAWSGQPARVGELRRGVARTRQGIAQLVGAMGGFDAALEAWQRHDCAGAQQAIADSVDHIPAAVERVNFGMFRLWRLVDRINPRYPG